MSNIHQLATANRQRQARANALSANRMTHAPNAAALRGMMGVKA